MLGDKKQKDYSEETRKEEREELLNKQKYHTHLIDSFHNDPLKCKCGNYLRYIDTYDPLEGVKNEREYREKCINEMQSLWLRRKGAAMDT